MGKIKLLIIIVLICAASKNNIYAQNIGENTITLGRKPDLNYERKPQESNIIIDRVGYIPTDKKVFYIKGRDLEKGFQILDNQGQEVFKGSLRRVSKDGEEKLYMGDFTGLEKNGRYRIFQYEAGFSDEFIINSDIYEAIKDRYYNEIADYKFSNVDEKISTLSFLLLSREIYPDNWKDNKVIDIKFFQNNIMELLAISSMNENQQAAIAGLIGQYAQVFKNTDLMFFNSAMKSAADLYISADRKRGTVSKQIMYYSAAQLYRATGYEKYLNRINEYDMENLSGGQVGNSFNDYSLLGDIAYLSTSFATDYQRCEDIFGGLVEKTKSFASTTDKATYYVQDNITDIDDTEILNNCVLLGLVSYVLTSHEYASIQSSYIHYIFGLNNEKRNIVDIEKKLTDGDFVNLSKLELALNNKN